MAAGGKCLHPQLLQTLAQGPPMIQGLTRLGTSQKMSPPLGYTFLMTRSGKALLDCQLLPEPWEQCEPQGEGCCRLCCGGCSS